MLLKTLLNDRNISSIPQIFDDNKPITNFKEKSKLFNSFFSEQSSLIDNGSTLPSLFSLITDRSLSNVVFSIEDIKKLISRLDSNIDSVFACLYYVINPFANFLILSSNLVGRKVFSNKCRTISQKHDRQLDKNYRPLSLFHYVAKLYS